MIRCNSGLPVDLKTYQDHKNWYEKVELKWCYQHAQFQNPYLNTKCHINQK